MSILGFISRNQPPSKIYRIRITEPTVAKPWSEKSRTFNVDETLDVEASVGATLLADGRAVYVGEVLPDGSVALPQPSAAPAADTFTPRKFPERWKDLPDVFRRIWDQQEALRKLVHARDSLVAKGSLRVYIGEAEVASRSRHQERIERAEAAIREFDHDKVARDLMAAGGLVVLRVREVNKLQAEIASAALALFARRVDALGLSADHVRSLFQGSRDYSQYVAKTPPLSLVDLRKSGPNTPDYLDVPVDAMASIYLLAEEKKRYYASLLEAVRTELEAASAPVGKSRK